MCKGTEVSWGLCRSQNQNGWRAAGQRVGRGSERSREIEKDDVRQTPGPK